MAKGDIGPTSGSSGMDPSGEGLEDDFVERIKKKLRKPFCERVAPTHLMIYLTCLNTSDEEYVRAQQEQRGDIHAASILFDLLVKKPNWLSDLVNALKDPGIGLQDLADEFEAIQNTVPIRWHLVGFTGPDHIQTCFDGHGCGDNTVPKVVSDPDNTVAKVVSLPTASALDIVRREDLKRKREELDLKEKEERLKKEENQNKKEKLRLDIMETLVEVFKTNKDFTTFMTRMKHINLEFTGTEKGSILFNIQVRSQGDLDRLESLWRYGGLKKMLDKEMMSSEKMQAIEEISRRFDYRVTDIISRVHIHQTDIDRCRAWLQQRQTVSPLPTDTSSGLMMSDTDQKFRRTAKYVRDRLPRYFRVMTEDPFLMERMHTFYDLVESQKHLKSGTSTEVKASTSTASRRTDSKSVAELFWNWFEEEMSAYLKALTEETLSKIEQMSCICFLMIESHQKSHVPKRLQTFPFATSLLNVEVSDSNVKLKVPSLDADIVHEPLSISSLLDVPLQQLPDIEFREVEAICTYLCEKGVMTSTKYGSSFASDLVLGVFVANLLSKCSKSPVSFDEPLLEIFRQFLPFGLVLVAWNRSCDPDCIFKDHNILSLCVNKGNENVNTLKSSPWVLIWNEESDLFPKDMAKSYSSNCKVEVAESTTQAAKSLTRNKSINLRPPSKAVSVDLSKKTYDNVEKYLPDVLRWLNLFACTNRDTLSEVCKANHINMKEMLHIEASSDNTMDGEPATKKAKHTSAVTEKSDEAKLVSMNLSGQMLNREALDSLAEFMLVTYSLSTLQLRDCHIQDTRSFMSGHFENLAHLDLSENTDLRLQDSVGLQFLPNLEGLDMQSCDLGDTGVTAVASELRHLSKLRELNLANNSLSAKGLIELSSCLESNRNLTSLRLNKNPIGGDGAVILAAWLHRLLLLEVLNIGECEIANGLDEITRSLVSKSLRKLSVRGNEFDTAGVNTFLNVFTRPPYLNHLDFSANAICEHSHQVQTTQDNATAFVRLLTTGNETWSYISLWKCGLGSVRIFMDVEKFTCLENLTYFCLQENSISNNFAKDIASCIKKHCYHLQHLNLRDNEIGDDGCLALADAIKSQAFLKEIFLDRNNIDVRGVTAMTAIFRQKQVIQEMDLSFNDLQGRDVDILTTDLKMSANALKFDMKEDDTMGHFVLRRV